MKRIFTQAVASGILAATLAAGVCAPAFAEVSAYNGTAVRKPGERRVADAAFVAEKCWRPLTGEGAERYPQAVDAIASHATETVLGTALLDRVKKADIAFCPPSAGAQLFPVSYSADMRIASVAAGIDEGLMRAYLRNAAAQGALLSDSRNNILDTASTEKKIRHDLYLAASAAAQEIAIAIEEKEAGRPESWERVRQTYDTTQDATLATYMSSRAKGQSKGEALSAATAVAVGALFEDAEWLKVQMFDVLTRTVADMKSGAFSNRPVDDADEKLETLFRRSGALTAEINFASRIGVPSKESLFRQVPEALWAVQAIDAMRYASGYGPDNYRVDAVFREMAETKNPEFLRLIAPKPAP